MVVTHFGLVDVVEKQLYIIPRVMMASDDAVLARLFFYDNPEYKRHPNYTKTDRLPISEVITGLPRPYHHILHYGEDKCCTNFGRWCRRCVAVFTAVGAAITLRRGYTLLKFSPLV